MAGIGVVLCIADAGAEDGCGYGRLIFAANDCMVFAKVSFTNSIAAAFAAAALASTAELVVLLGLAGARTTLDLRV